MTLYRFVDAQKAEGFPVRFKYLYYGGGPLSTSVLLPWLLRSHCCAVLRGRGPTWRLPRCSSVNLSLFPTSDASHQALTPQIRRCEIASPDPGRV